MSGTSPSRPPTAHATPADDRRVLLMAAVPTVIAGAVVTVIAGLVNGGKGVLGGVLGTLVVLAFCGAGLAVLMRVRQRNTYALLNAAMATYLVKILLLFALLFALRDATWLDPKAFGWSILVGVLVWTTAEVRAFSKLQLLYVDPAAGVDTRPPTREG